MRRPWSLAVVVNYGESRTDEVQFPGVGDEISANFRVRLGDDGRRAKASSNDFKDGGAARERGEVETTG